MSDGVQTVLAVGRPVEAVPRLHRYRLDLWLFAYLAAHLLLWTLLPALSHSAPPWDNIEQMVWMQSWEWGYYKHPPAPTWWLHAWTLLLGRSVWVTYFAAQLNVVIALYCVWRIGLLLTTRGRAFTAVVLTSLIAYHGLRGIMANHNTLQLMPVGLLLWATLAAVRQGGWGRWSAVGVVAALCLLTKYTALVWFAALALWWMLDERMHDRRQWVGVAWAALVCLTLCAPHLQWLMQRHFASFDYARNALAQPHGIARELMHFVRSQMARLLPLLVAIPLVRLGAGREGISATAMREGTFLRVVGLSPLLMTATLGLCGAHLDASWASTFFLLFGLLALGWIPALPVHALVRRSLVVGVCIELLLSGSLALGRGWLVDVMHRQARSNFPAAALAAELDAQWHERVKSPLRVISGDTWLAGNVSVHLKDAPKVLIDGDTAKASWIDPSLIDDCGMLVVLDETAPDAPSPQAVRDQLASTDDRGDLRLQWGRSRGTPRLRVAWGIVPPKRPERCSTDR